jgi:hypothetical protein
MQTESNLRPFEALISQEGPLSAAVRVSVFARNLDEAKEKLEAEYGRGRVASLWNEEDAKKPRHSS